MDKIADALARETGKAPFDVIGEMFSVCLDISHYSSKAPKWLKPKKVSTFPLLGKKGLIMYRPYGLVGVISPWNAPLTLALWRATAGADPSDPCASEVALDARGGNYLFRVEVQTRPSWQPTWVTARPGESK